MNPVTIGLFLVMVVLGVVYVARRRSRLGRN
jgi:hypothetical protein